MDINSKYVEVVRVEDNRTAKLKKLDVVEKSKTASEKTFRSFMKTVAPAYYSGSMIPWGDAYHVGKEEYKRFFKQEKVVQELDVMLMYSKTKTFSDAMALGGGPRGLGETGYFKFAKDVAFESNLSMGRGFKEIELPDGKRSSYSNIHLYKESNTVNSAVVSQVLTALLKHVPISEIAENKEHCTRPFWVYGGGVQLYIPNPTTKRIESSVDDFGRFFDYSKRNIITLLGVTDLVDTAFKVASVADKVTASENNKKSTKLIREEADKVSKKLLKEADARIGKMKVPSFPNLEDKLIV